MAERRKIERFDLAAPAQLVVESVSGKNSHLSLTTKDVSSAGAFLFCPQPLVEGSRVKMELFISLEKFWKLAGERGNAKIRVRGTVVRVDADGIAIRFESKYKITTFDRGDSGKGWE
jgi:hypothetical protein